MSLENWRVGIHRELKKRAYWCADLTETLEGVDTVAREEWTAEDYFSIIELMLVDASQYKATTLPSMMNEAMVKSGFGVEGRLQVAKAFAEMAEAYLVVRT